MGTVFCPCVASHQASGESCVIRALSISALVFLNLLKIYFRATVCSLSSKRKLQERISIHDGKDCDMLTTGQGCGRDRV